MMCALARNKTVKILHYRTARRFSTSAQSLCATESTVVSNLNMRIPVQCPKIQGLVTPAWFAFGDELNKQLSPIVILFLVTNK